MSFRETRLNLVTMVTMPLLFLLPIFITIICDKPTRKSAELATKALNEYEGVAIKLYG